jgi:hypothetical protein
MSDQTNRIPVAALEILVSMDPDPMAVAPNPTIAAFLYRVKADKDATCFGESFFSPSDWLSSSSPETGLYR